MKFAQFGIFVMLYSFQSHAYAAPVLGEILSVSAQGVVRFYVERTSIQSGELLTAKNRRGQAFAELRVTRVAPPFAEAVIESVWMRPFEPFEPLQVGHTVRLATSPKKQKFFSFVLGANQSEKVEEFGGRNSFLGLVIGWHFTEQWLWLLQLQADTLGTNSLGIEKRRGAYMLGLGYSLKGFMMGGQIGLIDTMTIAKDSTQTFTGVDPFSGVPYSTVSGVAHANDWGFLLSLRYSVYIKEMTRNNRMGWSLSPSISYANTFRPTPYGSYISAGISVDLWTD